MLCVLIVLTTHVHIAGNMLVQGIPVAAEDHPAQGVAQKGVRILRQVEKMLVAHEEVHILLGKMVQREVHSPLAQQGTKEDQTEMENHIHQHQGRKAENVRWGKVAHQLTETKSHTMPVRTKAHIPSDRVVEKMGDHQEVNNTTLAEVDLEEAHNYQAEYHGNTKAFDPYGRNIQP